MKTIDRLKAQFEQQRDLHIAELLEFLKYDSISAGDEHKTACRQCARMLASRMQSIGFAPEIVETSGHPLVLATRKGEQTGNTLLIYGHYDVQPVDPLDLWTTPPFEPRLEQGRIHARGAQDNKGQISFVLAALKDALEAGTPLPNITLLIEGGEEIGSPGLTHVLPQLAERVQADLLLVCDTNAADDGRPAIVAGLRGIIHLTAVLHGPDHDLHSGLHGGTAPNPLQGMAKLVTTLFREAGSIAVDGYLDDVIPPSAEALALAEASTPAMAGYERQCGAPPTGGPKGTSFAERHSFLPTIDINGLHGGFGGDGMKTIIPARGIAKISSRLVPGQDPATALDRIITHLKAHVPEGMRLEISESGVGGPGFRLDIHSAAFKMANAVLETLDKRGVAMLWEGASIPIVSSLAEASGATPLLIGFGSNDDRIHAPNESFGLDQFERGYCFAALLLERCGRA